MKYIRSFLQTLKKNWLATFIGVCIFAVVLANVIRLMTPPPPPPIQDNTWSEITPGYSSAEQVVAKLGPPLEQQPFNGGTKLLYKSAWALVQNEVEIQSSDGKVSFIKEYVGEDPANTLAEVKKKFGQEDVITYSTELGELYRGYVYLSRGVVVIADGLTGQVMQRWYFPPMDRATFLAKYGDDLTIEQPTPELIQAE